MRIHRWGARWGTAGLAGALLAASLLLVGSPRTPDLAPAAANTYLCTGYAACKKAGYSDGGYGAVNNKMYWRMYAGHNCTNYAAYRVIKAGGPKERPWSGGGNASEWGLQMKKITDNKPNVGAIAWWGRYSNGSGSAGHVAYVEKVVSANEIIVSEDSWGGTFHWRRITKSSGRWPTGFIHFVDKAITPTKATPGAKGGIYATVGKTLTARPGFWSVDPTKLSYSWFVDGERKRVYSRTFTPGPEDLGKPVTYKVRAQRAGYSDGFRFSKPTPAVRPGTFTVPRDAKVTGTPHVGKVLTATTGSWAPDPERIGWRWFADGKRIANQGAKLTLTDAMVGKAITVRPTAVLDGYKTTAAAPLAAGTVRKGQVAVDDTTTITGKPVIGNTLTVVDGKATPAKVSRTYQWFRDGVKIPGATSPSYKLTAADVGTKTTARTALHAPDWAKRMIDLPSPGLVTSKPTVKIGIDRSGRSIVVRVRVTAPAVAPVNGKVVIKVHKRTETVRLVDGRARVSVKFQTGGKKAVTANYQGSTRVPAGNASTSVTIK